MNENEKLDRILVALDSIAAAERESARDLHAQFSELSAADREELLRITGASAKIDQAIEMTVTRFDTVADRLETVARDTVRLFGVKSEQEHEAMKEKILAEWHNRRPGIMVFSALGVLAVVIAALVFLATSYDAFGFFAKMVVLVGGTVGSTVLLLGDAHNDIKDDSSTRYWHRLRVRGKLLAVSALFAFACTLTSFYTEKKAHDREVGELYERVTKLNTALAEAERRLSDSTSKIGGTTAKIDDTTKQISKENEELKRIVDAIAAASDELRRRLGADVIVQLTKLLNMTPQLARTSDLAQLARSTELSALARSSELGTLAKSSELGTLAKSSELGSLAKSSELGSLAKSSELGSLAKSSELGTLAKSSELGCAKVAESSSPSSSKK